MNLEFAGKHLEFPTEEQLRQFLLSSAERFHHLTGMPRTEIGQRAMHDPAFLGEVGSGRNITLRSFETFLGWLDAHWPEPQGVGSPRKSRSPSHERASERGG